MNLANHDDVMAHIYASGYFTNHGPLAKQLEETLQALFPIDHAVVVGNESLALIMALAGLNLRGRVGVSADCPEFVSGAVAWAGLEAVAGPGSQPPDKLVAVLVCARRGTFPDPALLRHAQSRDLPAVVYQHGHFSRHLEPAPVITVTSLGGHSEAPSAHCAAILTSDPALAEKYRNIRSSYGARKIVDVRATANGRVSEFQAGMALLFLQNPRNQSG